MVSMMEVIRLEDVTAALVRTGAIQIDPSGIKLSSRRISCIYFNVGDQIISFPDENDLITEALAQTYRSSGISSDRLIGTPEGANCMAASLRYLLRIGQLRIREKIEEHGAQRSIEGSYLKGDTFTAVEDVISTGYSTLSRVIEPAKKAGLVPNQVICLIDRQLGGIPMFQDEQKIPAFAFTNITAIGNELLRTDAFDHHRLRLVEKELQEINSPDRLF